MADKIDDVFGYIGVARHGPWSVKALDLRFDPSCPILWADSSKGKTVLRQSTVPGSSPGRSTNVHVRRSRTVPEQSPIIGL